MDAAFQAYLKFRRAAQDLITTGLEIPLFLRTKNQTDSEKTRLSKNTQKKRQEPNTCNKFFDRIQKHSCSISSIECNL